MRTSASQVEPAESPLVFPAKPSIPRDRAPKILLHAALGAIALAVSAGGCATVTPDRCGAHTAAKDPPPLSVRCSVRF